MGFHLRNPNMNARILSVSSSTVATGGGSVRTFTGYHLTGLTDAVWGAIWTPYATHPMTSVTLNNDGSVDATAAAHAAGAVAVTATEKRSGPDNIVVVECGALTYV